MPIVQGDYPLAPPPSGQTPNFAHPQSNARQAIIGAIICILITVIFPSLRIYSNLFIRKHRSIDDYTFWLGAIGNLVFVSLSIGLLENGTFGHHNWELHLSDLRNTSFLDVLLLESLGPIVVFIIKLSLILQFLCIFGRLRWMKLAAYYGITVMGLYYLSIVIARLAMCAPRGSETYVISLSTAHCRRVKVTGAITGGFNIVSDLYLLLLPIPAVLGLNRTLREKLGVLAIFMTGVIAVIASIMGLVYRARVNSDTDETWKIVPFYVAINVENTCGIVVICMPAIAKIIRHHWGTRRANSNQANNNASGQETPSQEGTPIRMTRLPTLASLRDRLSHSKSSHAHQNSYDSQAQIRGRNLGDKALEETTALPEIELTENPKL